MVKVKSSDGKSYSVGVSLDMYVTPRFKCPPPNTAHSSPIAVISQSGNMHGDLTSWFYVVRDNDFDPQYMVLWDGDSGSQAQDDQARLNAGAWTKLSQFYNEEEGRCDEVRAQQVLLYAFVGAVHEAWGYYEKGFDAEGGGSLSDVDVDALVRDALAGRPLQCRSDNVDVEQSGDTRRKTTKGRKRSKKKKITPAKKKAGSARKKKGTKPKRANLMPPSDTLDDLQAQFDKDHPIEERRAALHMTSDSFMYRKDQR